MNLFAFFSKCLLLATVVPLAMSSSDYKRGTKEDVRRVLSAAIKYYKLHGAQKAFRKFNDDPVPEFFDSDIFIAVAGEGKDGIVMANPDDLDSVGKRVDTVQDAKGANVGKKIIRKTAELKAKGKKGGWLPITYLVNPVNNEVERKQGYIYLYDGYIFGSGYYLPND